MKTILVDDEMLSLEHFQAQCGDIPYVEIAGCFEYPLDALEYARKNPVDCAVLDINMPEMNGLELGKSLQEIQPDVVLIYVTGYGEYASEAMAMRAATYLMKPYSKDDILFAMGRAKLLCQGDDRKLRVKTFGRFDVFYDNRPVVFKNAKARELFALCVDHNGGIVTMEEAIDKLWEGRPYNEQTKALYRKAVMALRNQLAAVGEEEVFVKNRASCHVVSERILCDYFDLMAGDEKARSNYMGEFMEDYSWAEVTEARLTRMMRRKQ